MKTLKEKSLTNIKMKSNKIKAEKEEGKKKKKNSLFHKKMKNNKKL